MKIVFRVWIVITLVLVIIVGLKLFDTYVSKKYEVDEPKAMSTTISKSSPEKLDDVLQDKEKHINTLINWLWIFCIYMGITAIVMVFELNQNKTP